jgi:hypothetical protein
LADDRTEQPEDDRWPQDTRRPRRWEWSTDGSSFLEHQLRCLDLVPRRWITLCLLLLAGAGTLVGLEAAYFDVARRAAATGAGMVTALDLSAKGSLACWFSSLLLLAAFAAAMLIYSVRKHRADDYEGRYRVWLWAGGCCLFAATDQAASLREAFRDALAALGGPRMVGDGWLWLGAAYLVVLGAIGARLVADMRACRLSTAALLAAAVAQTAAAAARLGWVTLSNGTWQIMLQAGSEMAGQGLLLAAMGLHARWLILDAEAELNCQENEDEQPKERADQRQEDRHSRLSPPSAPSRASGAPAAEKNTRVDPQHGSPQPVGPRTAAPSLPQASPSPGTSSPAIPTVARKLTKDERKALKARLLRQRQQREQG